MTWAARELTFNSLIPQKSYIVYSLWSCAFIFNAPVVCMILWNTLAQNEPLVKRINYSKLLLHDKTKKVLSQGHVCALTHRNAHELSEQTFSVNSNTKII